MIESGVLTVLFFQPLTIGCSEMNLEKRTKKRRKSSGRFEPWPEPVIMDTWLALP